MNKLLTVLALVGGLFIPSLVLAQATPSTTFLNGLGFNSSIQPVYCIDCGAATITGAVNSGATASTGDPTYSAGVNPLSQDLSGHLRVTLDGVTETINLPAGAATAANQATEIADLASLAVTVSGGSLNVQGLGTAGTQTGGIVTVQGDPGGTPIPVSGSFTLTNYALETGGNLASIKTDLDSVVTQTLGFTQGSTTSGQHGDLILCAITTGAPSYTTAQSSPFSCDTSGNLRITGANLTFNAPPGDILTGPINVTGAQDVIVNSQGSGSVGIQITGTFTGLSGLIRASVDGTNYFNILAYTPAGAAVVPGTAITAAGSWFVPAAGWRNVEFHATAVSTGTAVISVNASNGSVQPLVTATGGSATDIVGYNAVAVGSGNPIFVSPVANTAAGEKVKSVIVANNTTSVAVNTSPGNLYAITAYSISAATPVFIKLYNATQGSTTCGSGTPVIREMTPAPGASGGGAVINLGPAGYHYTSALTYCITAGIADADTTSPAASTYIVNFYYD